MSHAKAVRLQGSQAALVTLAEQARQRAVTQAQAEFHAACEVVLREHGLGAGTFTPDPGTGAWLLLIAPGSAVGTPAPAYADPVPQLVPLADVAPSAPRRRFTDASALLPDEAQRYEALRAQMATAGTATAADEALDERVSGAELLAATGVDFGAFGAL